MEYKLFLFLLFLLQVPLHADLRNSRSIINRYTQQAVDIDTFVFHHPDFVVIVPGGDSSLLHSRYTARGKGRGGEKVKETYSERVSQNFRERARARERERERERSITPYLHTNKYTNINTHTDLQVPKDSRRMEKEMRFPLPELARTVSQ